MFVSIPDNLHSDPRLVQAGDGAGDVLLRALSLCGSHATDGWVPRELALSWRGLSVLERMVRFGLLREVCEGEVVTVTGRKDTGGRKRDDAAVVIPGDGFFVCDLLKINPTASEYEALRQKKVDAANDRWAKPNPPASPPANAPASPPANASPMPVPDPDPGPEENKPPAKAELTNTPGENDDEHWSLLPDLDTYEAPTRPAPRDGIERDNEGSPYGNAAREAVA